MNNQTPAPQRLVFTAECIAVPWGGQSTPKPLPKPPPLLLNRSRLLPHRPSAPLDGAAHKGVCGAVHRNACEAVHRGVRDAMDRGVCEGVNRGMCWGSS